VDDGGNDSGGRRERLMKNKNGKGADFFPNFGLRFLDAQCLEFILIYRGWKRDTLFFIWDIYWPLIQLIRISTVGSKVQS
jgi:hypothetical protein